MKVSIYRLRNPDGPPAAGSEDEIIRCVRDRGWDLVAEYQDTARSFSPGPRLGMEQATDDARRHRFEALIVGCLADCGAGIREAVHRMHALFDAGVRFVAVADGIDTGDPAGAAIVRLVETLVRLEVFLHGERIRAGVERARRMGKRLGRPAVAVDSARLAALRASGMSIRDVARATGLSRSRVGMILRGVGAGPTVDPAAGAPRGVDIAEVPTPSF